MLWCSVLGCFGVVQGVDDEKRREEVVVVRRRCLCDYCVCGLCRQDPSDAKSECHPSNSFGGLFMFHETL
jgi:hypothetical protein